MSLLDHFSLLAVLAGAVTLALQATGMTSHALAPRAERWARRFALATAGLGVLAFAHLIARFIVLDLAHETVYLYTRVGLPLRYRIAGAWAGRDGSLLLWAAWMAVVAAFLHRPARDAETKRARQWTALLYGVFAFAFLVAAWLADALSPTPQWLLEGRPEGNGLNPTLQSPFILIHPPIMFLAYALAAVPAAAVMAHMLTGTNQWSRIASGPSRLDWILYTFAMGLGGIWAYYTLGFGGYWAWDPVEVANLLPWLALSVYLHAQLHHRRHDAFRVAGPMLGLLPFVLTMFSTISTRSGLWVSVHAFTDPTNTFEPDALARFLGILEAEPGLLFHVGMMLAVLLAGLALWTRRLALDHDRLPRVARIVGAVLAAAAALAIVAPASLLGGAFELAAWTGRPGLGLLGLGAGVFLAAAAPAFADDTDARVRVRLNLKTLLYASVLVLSLGLVVLVLFHFAAVNGWSTAFYDVRLPVLATPALVLLTLLALHGTHGRRRAIQATAGVLVAAGVAAAVYAPSRPGAFLLVLALGASIAGFDRVVRAASPAQGQLRIAHAALIGGAILNVVFWCAPPSILGLWRPVWPTQAIAIPLAVATLWMALRHAGGHGPRWGAPLAVGALGAYYLAPVLAAVAWFLERKSHAQAPRGGHPARMHQASLYLVHFAVAFALLGYATSTYFGGEVTEDLEVGESLRIGTSTFTYVGPASQAEAGTPWAAKLLPTFRVEHQGAAAEAPGILYWEPQTASHYPLPTTIRHWTGDVYWNLDAVCTGPCDGQHDEVRAYEQSVRVPAQDPMPRVSVQVSTLPGLGMVWGALALLVSAVSGLMVYDRR